MNLLSKTEPSFYSQRKFALLVDQIFGSFAAQIDVSLHQFLLELSQ